MRALITGATGFAGRHLAAYLSATQADTELHGTSLNDSAGVEHVTFHTLDLRDRDAVFDLVTRVQPNHIYHLAAQSSPRQSFRQPWETLENNIGSQLNLILSCLETPEPPRLLIVSSAEIYGNADQPLTEDMVFTPTSPYGVSKIAQDMLGLQYHLSHKLPIIRARPFNHFGPGQREGFVAPDFAMQVARIEAGVQPPIIEVGNLNAQRDFTDVRDVIRAYHLLMEHGQPGSVYNVASGKTYSIQYMLDTLLAHSTTTIQVRQDPTRMLPVDVPIKCGDAARLRTETGWEPLHTFEDTLRDLLEDCRRRVRTEKIEHE